MREFILESFVGLIILDGLGISRQKQNNAVLLAQTPYLDSLFKSYPHNTLVASGEAVGLPEGQMGNSEVGHLNLGAGRIVYQSLTKINKAIKEKTFFQNESFLQVIKHVKKHNSKLHLVGMISDGGIHSHINHAKALLAMAEQNNLTEKTYLHTFTDGRDTSPKSGLNYLKPLLEQKVKIASVAGRYYAMDRDNNWERINTVYNMLVSQKAPIIGSVIDYMEQSYRDNITDEFIKPAIADVNGLIEDNDGVIFFNFRPDRIVRLATALSNPTKTDLFITPGKTPFQGEKTLNNVLCATMSPYAESVKGAVAFQKEDLTNTFGEVVANHNLVQLRIAETEKYPHVTFFFNGSQHVKLKGCEEILIPSPAVPTYDLKPEMSALEIAAQAKEAILSKQYQTMVLNFANPDMVGHTGSLEAAIAAVEATDKALKTVVEAILSVGGKAVVVADHGNAEQMADEQGRPHTAHTTNLVPVIVTDENVSVQKGALCDVAPTLLALLKIPQPKEMTGKSLIK